MAQMAEKNDEEQKKTIRMNIIYKALEDGWSVRKSDNNSETFEFTKNKSLEEDYRGLIIFSKSNNANICEDIQKHLENLKEKLKDKDKRDKKHERSISTPVIKS